MRLLQSDALVVSSELDVFAALSSWVEYDLVNRSFGFAQRVAAALRLCQLTMEDLIYLDSHPLVFTDRMATQLVASTYLQRLMGTSFGNHSGMSSIGRRRRCQCALVPGPRQEADEKEGKEREMEAAAAGTPALSPLALAMRDAASTRGGSPLRSIFEAAVCYLSERQQLLEQQPLRLEQAALSFRRLSMDAATRAASKRPPQVSGSEKGGTMSPGGRGPGAHKRASFGQQQRQARRQQATEGGSSSANHSYSPCGSLLPQPSARHDGQRQRQMLPGDYPGVAFEMMVSPASIMRPSAAREAPPAHGGPPAGQEARRVLRFRE
jgi:hypothetical protein